MLQTIDQPRSELSAYAPKVEIMHIKPEKFVMSLVQVVKINEIIDETGVKLDIEQDGTIFIGAVDQEMINRARKLLMKLPAKLKLARYTMQKLSVLKNMVLL